MIIHKLTDKYKAFSSEPWNDDWNDRLIAFSIREVRHWWEGSNYIIEEFCVDPQKQGQGISLQLMKYIEADIKNSGYAGIFLQTDNDKPAYAFYQKLGFEEMSHHVSFYKSVK